MRRHSKLTQEAGIQATKLVSQVCEQFGRDERSAFLIVMASVLTHVALDLAHTDGHKADAVLNKGLDDALAWYLEGIEAVKAKLPTTC